MPVRMSGFDYLQKHIPATLHRDGLLAMLRDSMQYANQVAAGNWSLTCNRDVVRLNVGMIEVLVFTVSEVNMVVDMPTFDRIEAVTPMPCTYEGIFPADGEPAYASVPNSAAIFVVPADAVAAMHIMRPAHEVLIRNAARTHLNPAAGKAHQGEVAQWALEMKNEECDANQRSIHITVY